MKFFYTYVLKSEKDKKLYIGSTADLKERIRTHNEGYVQSTKSRRPLELVYFEGCRTKFGAEKREKYFKTGFGRKYLKLKI